MYWAWPLPKDQFSQATSTRLITRSCGFITWPQADLDASQLARYANVPDLAVLREKLIQQLLDYLRQNLSPDKAPTELILMHALPMTSDGQVNIHKLPVPDTPTG